MSRVTMWFAQTDDEALFIAAIQEDRDSDGPMLVYADWLEEQGEEFAAEFLRIHLSPAKNQDRLTFLREKLDARWLTEVSRRFFRAGDSVRINAGDFEDFNGKVVSVDGKFARAQVQVWFGFSGKRCWVDISELTRPNT